MGPTYITDRVWNGTEWVATDMPDKLKEAWRRILTDHQLDVPQLLEAARALAGFIGVAPRTFVIDAPDPTPRKHVDPTVTKYLHDAKEGKT